MSIGQLISSIGKIIGYGFCRVLPMSWVSALGSSLGRYSEIKQCELDARVKHNLDVLNLSARATDILPALEKEAGRAALEVLISDKIEKYGHIKWQPHTGLDAAVKANRSLVFVTIHMANLGDIVGIKISAQLPQYKIYFITRFIQSYVENSIMRRCRKRIPGKVLSWLGGDSSTIAKQVLQALRQPPSLVLLHIDEAKHHQVAFPTFGRKLPKESNLRFAIRFATLSGACLVPVLLIRPLSERLQFELSVLNVFDLAEPEKLTTHETLINQIDALYTDAVKQTPEQWLSFYNLRL